MRIIDLAIKDLRQIIRDKRSLFFLLLMPLVFTVFMGFASRPASKETDPRLPVGWTNLDGESRLSVELKSMLDASSVVRMVAVETASKGAEQVRKGELAAALIVPAGFSEHALAGAPVQLPLVALENTAGGQSGYTAVEMSVTRLLSAVEAGRIAVEKVDAFQAYPSSQARQSTLGVMVEHAVQAWSAAGLAVDVEKYSAALKQPGVAANPYNQTSPGMMVMFGIFGLINSANLLVMERRTRTLQRLLTTSMNRWQIIAGHLLAMFLTVFLQETVLIFFGQTVLGVNYLREPLGILLVMAAMALWVAGLGLLIGALAKGEDQVILYSMICMFLFSALGGAWFALDTTGPTFSLIGHLTPGAWAMDGFQNLLARGLGLGSVLLPVGVMLGYALVFFGAAVWSFKAE